MFTHRIVLKEVKRQSEPDLVKAIQEVAYGNISIESEQFIKGLNRPLPMNVDSVKLLARNDQVNEYNRKQIIEHPGQLYQFESVDELDSKHLGTILAEKILWLKKGAPVIHCITCQINWRICQGCQCKWSSGRLFISEPDNTHRKKEVFSPSRNHDVATRLQYPLKLSFAMTIHKSQGLTLDSLEIDCRQIFNPGQLSVALGRARETKGLRVINFSAKRSVIPQPAIVQNFLEQTSSDFQADRGCCIYKEQRCEQDDAVHPDFFTVADMTVIEEAIELNDTQPSTDEFDLEFDEVIKMLDDSQSESVQLPGDLNLQSILDSAQCKIVKTPMQYNINQVLKEIDHFKYTQFCKSEYGKWSALITALDIDSSKPMPSKIQTEFYSNAHAYQTSAEFRMKCLMLFENMQFTEDHLHICFSISI